MQTRGQLPEFGVDYPDLDFRGTPIKDQIGICTSEGQPLSTKPGQFRIGQITKINSQRIK